MAEIKAHEFAGFIRRHGTPYRIVLVYGPDRGLVSERAAGVAARTGIDLKDDFSVLRLEATDVAGDPGRLIDECQAISLFGGDRLVWLRNAGNERGVVDAVSVLADGDMGSSHLLIEAGDLKKGTGLRKCIESARTALAIPCYADDSRAIQSLIEEELSSAGLGIDNDGRRRLTQLLGGDRLASRAELRKLALYCHGRSTVTEADVINAIGDAAALSVDDAVEAVFLGEPARLDMALERIIASKMAVFLVLRSCIQQLQQLDLFRDFMENGGMSAQAVLAEKGRGLHFRRKPAIEKALRTWGLASIRRELSRLEAAILEGRRHPPLETAIARQALMRCCLISR